MTKKPLTARLQDTDNKIAMTYREGLAVLEERGIDIAKDDYKIVQKLLNGHTIVIATETLESPKKDREGNEFSRELVIRRMFEGEEPMNAAAKNEVLLTPSEEQQYDLSAFVESLQQQGIEQNGVKIDVFTVYEDRLPLF